MKIELYVYYINPKYLNTHDLYVSDDGENFYFVSNIIGKKHKALSKSALRGDARYEKYDPTIHKLSDEVVKKYYSFLKSNFYKEVLSE